MRRLTAAEACLTRALLRREAARWPDWAAEENQAYLAVVVDQGLAGILHDRLREALTDAPDAFAAALSAEAARIVALNGLRQQQVGRALGALAARDVPCVALKGVALVADGYAHLGLRPMADTDLLVAPTDMTTAGVALENLGYAREPMDSPDLAHHWTYVRVSAGGLPEAVELHQQLFAAAPWDVAVPTAELLGRRSLATWGGIAVPVLDPADRLLHAAGHLVIQHAGGERLIWVADIDRLVARGITRGGFWEDARRRAAEWGLTHALDEALAAAAEWFATPVPVVRPRGVESAPGSAVAVAAGPRPTGARVMADVAASPSWRRRAQLVRGHLLPRPADMRAWYGIRHGWQLPYYYLRRWMRGTRDLLVDRATPERARRGPDRWFVDDRVP